MKVAFIYVARCWTLLLMIRITLYPSDAFYDLRSHFIDERMEWLVSLLEESLLIAILCTEFRSRKGLLGSKDLRGIKKHIR